MRRKPTTEPAVDPTVQEQLEADVLRRLREVSSEAIREAQDAAREASRRSRENLRETVRQVRAVERETLRQVRDSNRPRNRDDAGSDTRSRIQIVALELFAERGYEATSLREIAERLGVTKAALYYHFKTKDEIIESYVAALTAGVDELIEWGQAQPRTLEARREFLIRYSDMLVERRHHLLMRFFEHNQSAVQQHKSGSAMRAKMLQMLDLLTPEDASTATRIRCSLAIFALHSSSFTIRDPDVSDDERRSAAVEVALDLIV
jgi:AcrR family transcriptional regulator